MRGEFISVQQVQTLDQLHQPVARFPKWLGFQAVDAMAVVDRIDGRAAFVPSASRAEACRTPSQRGEKTGCGNKYHVMVETLRLGLIQ